MIDPILLDEFATTFFGYGNPEAKTWFIGMEEGGGNTEDEINLRLMAWAERGRRTFEDVAEYHNAIQIPEHFRPSPKKAKLQPTWARLIEMMLASRGLATETENIRQYQATEWGRSSGDTCLLELMPLPSPNNKDWSYGTYCSDPKFGDRRTYEAYFRPKRIDEIRILIEKYAPGFVIFYGITKHEHWNAVAPGDWTEGGEFKTLVRGQTAFYSILHPAARRPAGYFGNVGRRILNQGGRL